MPKRNIVWIAIGAVIAVLLWKVPESIIRRDALYTQFSPLLDVRVQVLKHYAEPVNEDELLRGAIEGMLNRLDPYSEYYDAKEYSQFQMRTEGQFNGIGIWIDKPPRGQVVILGPIEGSPAFAAGLLADDRITRINGKETTDMSREDAVGLIAGPPGTSVALTIHRPASDETFEKTITRGVVTVRTVRGWARSADWEWDYLIDPGRRIGYVRISSFERRTAEQLDEVIRRLLVEHGMRALVLDVRDNPGGLLDVAVHIVNPFLRGGTIVTTKGRSTHPQPYSATRDNMYPDFPVVVLVNRGSASASEILAGALQDHGRAMLVGKPTFGKGSVQELFELGDKHGAVKLTTGYYYLPNGERIHGRGVVPDRIVELTPEERTRLVESQRAVYSTTHVPTTTQAASGPAGAPAGGRVEIIIDRQLEEALAILRQRLASQPSEG